MLRPLVWWWCAANFSADWLLNLAQIFGLPFRWATYEPTAAQETVDRICAMLQNMGSAGWAAFPSGTTLELRAEGQKSGRDTPQGDMLDRADKQCDLLVLGQTLTTDTGGMGAGGGSHALGQVHAEVRSGIIDAAAKFVSGVLEQQLIPSILRLNYGDAAEAPTLCLQEITQDNLQEKAAIIAQLQAAGAGSIIPLDWLGKTFGIPKPEPGEATLADAKQGSAIPLTAEPFAAANFNPDQPRAFDGRWVPSLNNFPKPETGKLALDNFKKSEPDKVSLKDLPKVDRDKSAQPKRQHSLPRPTADDILANYFKEEGSDNTVRERDWIRGYVGRDAFKEIREIEEAKKKTTDPKKIQALDDQLNTCALRMCLALNKSGFAIPKGLSRKVYPSYNDEWPDEKNTDQNGNPKDEYQKEVHYYISNAKEFDDYLKKTWGKPDFTIPLVGTAWEIHQKIIHIQENLAPGQVAVFAREGHTGIFTKSYMDSYASWPTHPLDIWILEPK